MRILLVFMILLLHPLIAHADSSEGIVSSMSVDTQSKQDYRVGYVLLKLNNVTNPNCSVFYLSPENTIAIGFAQHAFFNNIKIKIDYDENSKAPWGEGGCAIKTIGATK